MNTSNLIKLFTGSAFLLSTITSNAQIADAAITPEPAKQTVHLQGLKITPSIKEFRAGISTVDSSDTRIKLWVCNAEERKCSVAIVGNTGYLWTANFREAYYSQVFNFSEMEDGVYTIKVNNGKETFEKKITIITNSYIQRDLAIE